MKMEKSVQMTLIIVVGIVILGLLIFAAFKSINPSYNNTISVSGESTLEVMPDIIGVYFSVDTQGATSKNASDKNSEIVNKLINSLIISGFAREDIQTQSFNVYPEYNWNSGTQRLIGYRATHSLKVELSADESEKIGNVLDAGINAGAGVSYINFELSQENQNKYKAEAMKQAAQDATSKASGIAEGLGKRLGKLVSVSTDNYNYYPWLARDFAGASPAEVKTEATSISPSKQQISATVTAVYQIR